MSEIFVNLRKILCIFAKFRESSLDLVNHHKISWIFEKLREFSLFSTKFTNNFKIIAIILNFFKFSKNLTNFNQLFRSSTNIGKDNLISLRPHEFFKKLTNFYDNCRRLTKICWEWNQLNFCILSRETHNSPSNKISKIYPDTRRINTRLRWNHINTASTTVDFIGRR